MIAGCEGVPFSENMTLIGSARWTSGGIERYRFVDLRV